MFRFSALLFLIISLFPLASYASLKLPHLIGDGMVVQRFETIPIWGWASANEKITVVFEGESQVVTSDANGAWTVSFSPRKEGGPYALRIKQKNKETRIKNIWVGDVWVCSGQSNMEWELQNVNNAKKEIHQATDSNIHHFKVPKSWSVVAQPDLAGGSWQAASPQTAQNFTAVGYFFAKKIREHIDVPIGLIHSSWGGSKIEAWMTGSLLGMTNTEIATKLQKVVDKEETEKLKVEHRVNRWPGALVHNPQIDDLGKIANADWSAVDIKEDEWIELNAPALWETEGLNDLDGVAWYRKEFTLTPEETKHDLQLNLARIDDEDVTWVNGVKVGSTSVYDQDRTYKVSKSILNPGRNVIAIKVIDNGGGGGIYSDSLFSIDVLGKQRSLAGVWKFRVDKGRVSILGNKNHTPTVLYNKMIHPLFKVPVKGVLWYQGESNAGNPEQAFEYRYQFKKMITHWREKWGNKSLPFFWVQLANYQSGYDIGGVSPWAILRESQAQALSLPYTGQAITIDVGNPNDIHPRDKKSVGVRLANEAINKVYGKSHILYRGPRYLSMEKVKNSILVKMASNKSLKLSSASSGVLRGFTVAGKDRVFYSAKAILDSGVIIVSSEHVKQPEAVRYGWSDNPEEANLMDGSGLPAEPFRTDNW